jgi:hypothetical protein
MTMLATSRDTKFDMSQKASLNIILLNYEKTTAHIDRMIILSKAFCDIANFVTRDVASTQRRTSKLPDARHSRAPLKVI